VKKILSAVVRLKTLQKADLESFEKATFCRVAFSFSYFLESKIANFPQETNLEFSPDHSPSAPFFFLRPTYRFSFAFFIYVLSELSAFVGMFRKYCFDRLHLGIAEHLYTSPDIAEHL
jgi:hypothetical protein